MSELLPCPFCGKHESVKLTTTTDCFDFEKVYPEGFVVVCSASSAARLGGCGTTSPWQETAAGAIAAWNRRADTGKSAEPVGHVYTMEALVPGCSRKYHAQLYRDLPVGAKLYAEPVPGKSADADAKRFKWLSDRFTGFDADWGADHANSDPGKFVLVFNAPDDFRVSRDIGKSIDEYCRATEGGKDAG